MGEERDFRKESEFGWRSLEKLLTTYRVPLGFITTYEKAHFDFFDAINHKDPEGILKNLETIGCATCDIANFLHERTPPDLSEEMRREIFSRLDDMQEWRVEALRRLLK